MRLSEINTPVETLGGIGPSTARLFAKLNIFTVGDLLSTFPKNYDDRTKKVTLHEFETNQKVHTICKVTAHDWFGYGRMRTLRIAITDGTANAWLIAFNRPFLEKALPEGSIISVTGQFSIKYNTLQCTAFEAERLSYDGELSEYTNTNIPNSGLIPVYPLTVGLSQKNYRKAIALAIRQYGSAIDDEIPVNIINEKKLLHKKQAIKQIHIPQTLKEAEDARHSLIYEELYLFEYKMALRTIEHRGIIPTVEQITLPTQNESTEKIISTQEFENTLSPRQKQFLTRLPFPLTSDQIKVISEMNHDIDVSADELNKLNNYPEQITHTPFSMQRLLQADVGAGKTLVAFFICLRVIDIGGQCALLAPTELLARQHAENAAKLLEPLNVRVAFLTGNIKASGRGPLLDALKKGFINIIVGTHALFSKNVIYKNLQLAVIDEQHRFGVTQRESIVAKGRVTNKLFSHSPDVLMMSATPIPQTLALTVFGDLDVSVIHTMPKGRIPIQTYLSVEGHETNVYAAVQKELNAGHQAYFVYPCISSSTDSPADENIDEDTKSAQAMFIHLSTNIFPKYKCALIHSKVNEDEQNKILEEFHEGKINILVATTVVEVGVDVANATCMVIEHADNFGLAELHQLRGRVGRSSLQSYCFLVYSKKITETGIERMKALRQNTDGFVIAEEDLKLRGPGEVLGVAQSGYLTLGIADLTRDKELLTQARYDAFTELKKLYTQKKTGVTL